QPCFDISRCGSSVSSEDISPVSLCVNQQFFLPHLHHRISDTRISVWMILHGVSNHIGNFVVTSVVQLFHGVHNTTLNGFKTVFHCRNSTLQNHIRGIIQKPFFVHSGNFGNGFGCIFLHFLICCIFI